MINIIISIIKVVFLLGFLVFIHEGGHFLIAKLSKVKVKEFAIGFGPTLFKIQGKETKYALRLIPLGGFVNMLGEEERSEETGSFSKASIPKRIAIVVAGGLVNIIFGLVVYFALSSINVEYPSNEVINTIPEYPAQVIGIQTGDKILKINNKKIRLKTDIEDFLQQSNGEEATITIERNNNIYDLKIKPKEIKSKSTGLYFGVQGEEISCEVVALYPNSPAEKNGIQTKDKIIKVNGENVNNDPYTVVKLIEETEGKTITFTIQRKNETFDITLEPDIVSNYYLGVTFKIADKNFTNNIYYGFWNTVDFATSIIDNLKMLFTGKVSTNQLTGPIGISELIVKTKGIDNYIYIIALISLSLGITNLLPFPPLDGGKIVFLIIEGIRRKPIKEKIEVGIQMIGFFILIALSIYVAFNDILKIF